MKKIICLLFVSIVYNQAVSQSNIDSLKSIINNSTDDTSKIKVIDNLVRGLRYINKNEALDYAKQALRISKSTKSSKFIGISFKMLGRCYYQLGDSALALKYSNLGMKYSKTANDISNQIALFNVIALTHERFGDISKSISTFQEAITIAKQTNNKFQLGILHNNIGNSYKLISDYPNAIKNFLESLKITESIKDIDGMSSCYSGLGEVYRLTKNYSQALKYYRLGANLDKKTQDLNGLASSYNNLGITYMTINHNNTSKIYYDSALVLLNSKLDNSLTKANIYQNYGILFNDNYKNFKKANIFFKKSLIEYEQIGSKYEQTIALLNLGVNEYKLKNNQESIAFLKQAEKQSMKLKLNDVRSEIYKTLSEVYENMDQANISLKYHKKYALLKDSLFSQQNIKDLANYRTIYETEKKEKELLQKSIKIEKQQKFITKQRTWIFGSLFMLLTLGIIMYLVYRNYKRENTLNQQLNVLNGELVHRTKNQLQLLISFLSIQERTLDNLDAKATIQESKLRISAINLVNEKLNKSQELSKIDLQEYILELVKNLKNEFPEIYVKEMIKVPLLPIDAVKIARIGLIINELITNSYKYAFCEKTDSILKIDVIQLSDELIKLTIQDNGSFKNNIDLDNIKSTGLKLVKQMVKTLDGNIIVFYDNGMTFDITILI